MNKLEVAKEILNKKLKIGSISADYGISLEDTELHLIANEVDIFTDIVEYAEKQEKLLSQIKEIIDRQDDSYISSMLEESKRYYEIKELMIKELENE